MPNSVVDFWHMVVQEESDSIVMLTNTIEKGLNKCEQYWPNDAGQTASFGDITVSNMAVPYYKLLWYYGATVNHINILVNI